MQYVPAIVLFAIALVAVYTLTWLRKHGDTNPKLKEASLGATVVLATSIVSAIGALFAPLYESSHRLKYALEDKSLANRDATYKSCVRALDLSLDDDPSAADDKKVQDNNFLSNFRECLAGIALYGSKNAVGAANSYIQFTVKVLGPLDLKNMTDKRGIDIATLVMADRFVSALRADLRVTDDTIGCGSLVSLVRVSSSPKKIAHFCEKLSEQPTQEEVSALNDSFK